MGNRLESESLAPGRGMVLSCKKVEDRFVDEQL